MADTARTRSRTRTWLIAAPAVLLPLLCILVYAWTLRESRLSVTNESDAILHNVAVTLPDGTTHAIGDLAPGGEGILVVSLDKGGEVTLAYRDAAGTRVEQEIGQTFPAFWRLTVTVKPAGTSESESKATIPWFVVVNAVSLGALYALLAVGYTMVYGIIKLINFAHGEIFMMGTVAALILVAHTSIPLALVILISMAMCLVLGVVIDFSAYLPLRRKHTFGDSASVIALTLFGIFAIAYFAGDRSSKTIAVLLGAVPACLFIVAILGLAGSLGRPKATIVTDRLCLLITAIGMSLSLQTIALLIWSADYHSFRDRKLPEFLRESVFTLGNTDVLGKDLVIWIITIILMVALNYMVGYTKIGRAMRACALDKATASLMGVNVNLVIAVTFMVGSALAAVAGIFFGIKAGGNIYYRMGYYPGVIAFAAAVLGGIGNIRGAVAGGFIIGLVQALAQAIKPEFDFAFAFGVMILVILFRPWGIFGKAEAKRA
ncbi:MAG: branched-chain amino acid ABC transporter permease [Planctomycetota bacterium]|jgi:branched-chain amino acid transport system permease protein